MPHHHHRTKRRPAGDQQAGGPAPRKRRTIWVVRTTAGVAVAGVVAFGVSRPYEAPVHFETPHAEACMALRIIAAATAYDRVPPPFASPELEAYVIGLNTELALLRQQIKETCGG